jgi:hypothetical protein
MLKSLIGPWELFGYTIIVTTGLVFGCLVGIPPGMQTTFWGGLATAAALFVISGLIMHDTKIYKTGSW